MQLSDFERAAAPRPKHVISLTDALARVRHKHPGRVRRMRRDLEWLKAKAAAHNLEVIDL